MTISDFQAPIADIAADKEHKKSEKSYWERQLKIAKRLNLITLAYAVITAIGLIAVMDQIRLTRKSLDAATDGVKATREQTIEANRAMIVPDNATVKVTSISGADGQPLNKFQYSVDPENVGHAIATQVFFSEQKMAGFVPITPDIHGGPFIPKIDSDLCARTGRSDIKTSLFPGKKTIYIYNFPYGNESLTDEQISAYNTGQFVFYFADCVTYKTFGVAHKNAFCFAAANMKNISGNSEFKVFHCPANNDAD